MFAGSIGRRDEAKDEGEAGSNRRHGGPVLRGEQEGEASAPGTLLAR